MTLSEKDATCQSNDPGYHEHICKPTNYSILKGGRGQRKLLDMEASWNDMEKNDVVCVWGNEFDNNKILNLHTVPAWRFALLREKLDHQAYVFLGSQSAPFDMKTALLCKMDRTRVFLPIADPTAVPNKETGELFYACVPGIPGHKDKRGSQAETFLGYKDPRNDFTEMTLGSLATLKGDDLPTRTIVVMCFMVNEDGASTSAIFCLLDEVHEKKVGQNGRSPSFTTFHHRSPPFTIVHHRSPPFTLHTFGHFSNWSCSFRSVRCTIHAYL